MIFGPNQDLFSKDTDFNKDPKSAFYSNDKPLDNIEMMNDIVNRIRQPEVAKKKQIRKEERQKRKEDRT